MVKQTKIGGGCLKIQKSSNLKECWNSWLAKNIRGQLAIGITNSGANDFLYFVNYLLYHSSVNRKINYAENL